MEVSAKRNEQGEYLLALGPVTFTLPQEAVHALHEVIEERFKPDNATEASSLQRKLEAYRALANKMAAVDDRIIQKLATQITTEQLITLVRLADGETFYQKVVRNLSKQNRRQFEEDYDRLDRITEHSAVIHIDQVVPYIKKAAQEQKKLSES